MPSERPIHSRGLIWEQRYYQPVPPAKEPDPLARIVGHAVVGGAAFYLLRRFGATAIIVSALTIIAHEAFDAPVAQRLSELGI